MKLYVIILSLLLQGCCGITCVKASEADIDLQDAVKSAQEGDNAFAFMGFHTILEEHPKSSRSMAASFAQAEYYFLENDLDMASEAFKDFYTSYPHRDESMIALVYLFKMAQIQHDPKIMKEYQQKIASFRQLTFIFNEKKYFKFTSGFQRKYKLVYSINKVELYVNGQLFTEVPF